MEFIISQPFLHLPLLFVGLLIGNELLRRFKWMTVLLLVLSIVLLPLWLQCGINSWFTWTKLFSVIFGTLWLSLFRFSKFQHKNYAKIGIVLIIAVNIFEAVLKDALVLNLVGLINALSGILLILSLRGWRDIKVDSINGKNDLIWPKLTQLWVASYIIWNWIFVYLNYPQRAIYHFFVLLAATVATAYAKKASWMQARGYTLVLFLMYFFTFPNQLNNFAIVLPRNDTSMLILAVLSFVLNLLNALVTFRVIKIKK